MRLVVCHLGMVVDKEDFMVREDFYLEVGDSVVAMEEENLAGDVHILEDHQEGMEIQVVGVFLEDNQGEVEIQDKVGFPEVTVVVVLALQGDQVAQAMVVGERYILVVLKYQLGWVHS